MLASTNNVLCQAFLPNVVYDSDLKNVALWTYVKLYFIELLFVLTA